MASSLTSSLYIQHAGRVPWERCNGVSIAAACCIHVQSDRLDLPRRTCFLTCLILLAGYMLFPALPPPPVKAAIAKRQEAEALAPKVPAKVA